MGRRQRAFTLVELVIVILVLGILAAVAAPRFSDSLDHFRVEAAAKRIVADLKYAAVLSRVTSTEVQIEYDKGTGSDESDYRFKELPDPNNPGAPFDIGDNTTWYTVVLRDEPYAVVLLDAPGSITYDIYGMPKSSETFVVELGGEQRTIDVDKNTGDITVQ